MLPKHPKTILGIKGLTLGPLFSPPFRFILPSAHFPLTLIHLAHGRLIPPQDGSQSPFLFPASQNLERISKESRKNHGRITEESLQKLTKLLIFFFHFWLLFVLRRRLSVSAFMSSFELLLSFIASLLPS